VIPEDNEADSPDLDPDAASIDTGADSAFDPSKLSDPVGHKV
jgi:hypothetical protein